MKIAIASGKGGTGKTTLAVNIAVTLQEMGRNVRLIDCDVEEPNSHIFFKEKKYQTEEAYIYVPEIDFDKCENCGKCEGICEYNSLIYLKGKPYVFDDMCHACGFCMRVCPYGAIKKKRRDIGTFYKGKTETGVELIYGMLGIGQVLAPVIIDKILKEKNNVKNHITIVDAPPGTSCSAVASVKDADYVVLVTEPTPFGFHDLKLAVEMIRKLGRKFGVFINRADIGNKDVINYCKHENITVIDELAFIKDIARSYSKGEILVKSLPQLKSRFIKTCSVVLAEVSK